MLAPLTEKPQSLTKRGRFLFAALVSTVAMASALVAGPISSASADPFCANVNLGPNGQCHLPHAQAGNLSILSSHSPNRANCVALLGYYGEQLDSWVCAAAGTSPWYYVASWRPFGYYRAAVKNNSLSQSGNFTGFYYCCRP